ncbi:uncharacterized protein LOC135841600 [Planococcus citri]|uniref:uncharacterized protein LOC135841600 n=1 Tax=Planococcus citri TaxID=170843 RepID=UPI0031F96824
MLLMNLSLIYYLCYFIIDIAGLRVAELSIPRHVGLREKARLSCKFEITRGKLYSVKWYKDEFEFFRFMPDNNPNIQTFPVQGVYLDISKCNMTTVTLHQLNFNSSGNYRCEVSKDGPNFETVVKNGDMTVVEYPKGDPIIEGIQSSYSIGDFISGNCTSLKSNPAANLTWFINNQKADQDILLQYPDVLDDGPLYSITLGIHFRVQKDHFENNILELRCSAKIDDLPAWTREYKIHHQSFIQDMIHAQNRLNNGFALTSQFHVTITMLFLSCFNCVFM